MLVAKGVESRSWACSRRVDLGIHHGFLLALVGFQLLEIGSVLALQDMREMGDPQEDLEA